ncbi:MAG TPA: hypothetical protein VMD97_12790 [Candidatus Aquilonibacter sp.]|nr:hypothetical protein [Candidatus Aquilonibacter sp.]
MKTIPQFVLYSVLLAVPAGLLSGCSSNFIPSPVQPEQVPIGNIHGTVHGGQAPVSGAQIYLYAAGTGGYGTSATSLMKAESNTYEDGSGNYYALTDANGNFQIGGDYTCTEGTQVYMVAVGGNPGLSGTVNNTAIVQMAGLGQCPAAGNLAAQVPYLVINEVTTVAFAYAMGGFGSSAYNISSNAADSTASATAIANAMANANNIVNLHYGQAPAVTNGNSNSVNPQATIYALANILATCVNTSSASSSQCSSLFSTAKSPAGVPATDESSAIFNIVHMPANTSTYPTHVNDIWNLGSGTPVFTPTLSSVPTDWTMPVIYNALVSVPAVNGDNEIISGPYNIAFDANGNAWIGDRVKGVVEVGPQGAANTYNSGFGMIKGVAVSPADGTIWAADYANNVVDVLNSSGAVVATVTKGLGGNNNPRGPILTSFALDPTTGYMAYLGIEEVPGILLYEANPSTPYQYTKSGNAELGSNGFPDVDTPGWIAVDQTGQAWIPSTDTEYVGNWAVTWKNGSRSANADEAAGPESYSTASDGNSNIWLTTDTGTATLEEIRSGSTTVTSTETGGGMNEPYKMAIDGNNTVWIANDGANTVSAWSTASNSWLASSGFNTSAASSTGCVVIGVDGSGNVWTGNADGSVTQLLGLATPTATPFYGGMTVITGTGKTQTTVTTDGNLGTKP